MHVTVVGFLNIKSLGALTQASLPSASQPLKRNFLNLEVWNYLIWSNMQQVISFSTTMLTNPLVFCPSISGMVKDKASL